MNRECMVLTVILAVVSSQCSGGIPDTERQSFLDAHNTLRSTISAGKYVANGKNMPAAKTPIANMTWDCEIEKSAQKVSDTCIFAHSKNRTNLGENIWTMWASYKLSVNGMAKKACNSWEVEFQKFGWADIKLTPSVFSSGIGHATQMAWARSTKLGCGISLCKENQKVLVACQYRDAGNFINSNVYDPK
ncbi:hypothetical protein PRIPAC_79512 [Pristionchus pacificus]|uniref:SCP domain-containing protein n=1 Tax=Pristionchus pacificus TaxID=54126 RepID=A0A454XYQ9_PRIPA|nr:hypothetical protein PRIPAC_79512 [Pristionchus pacificus]|eukprot:PDM72765.1 hypothetical protein PRIPAC_39199 [Pristionchus pacificus]